MRHRKLYDGWDDPRLMRATIEMIEGCMTRCQPKWIPHWQERLAHYYSKMTDEQIRRLKEARHT